MRKPWGLLCAILIACTAILVCPGVSGAADPPGPYNPKRLEEAVMPRAMFLLPPEIWDKYYNWILNNFNWIEEFKDQDGRSGDGYTTYFRPSDVLELEMNSWDSHTVVNTLRTRVGEDGNVVEGDLEMMVRATFRNYPHAWPAHPKQELNAQVTMYFYQGTYWEYLLRFHATGAHSSAETPLGDGDWFRPVKTHPGWELFRIRFIPVASCGCAHYASVSKVAVLFRDLTGPKIERVYVTSDPNGLSPDTSFKAGDLVYIHLEFDEYVRLSDDDWALHENAPLYLDVANIAGVGTTGVQVAARLAGLKDKRVTFVCEVPATLNIGESDVPTNHYIIGLSANQPGLLVPESAPVGERFPLKMLRDGDKPINCSGGELGSRDELHWTTSLITDLAGNPVKSLECGFDKVIRIDNVPPELEAVEVTRHPSSGSLHVGPGDQVVITALFSELLSDLAAGDLANVVATVNLKQGADYVTTTASRVSVNHKEQTTAVEFSPITIAADMVPEPVTINDQDLYNIRLTGISHNGLLSDQCGNGYGGAVTVAPREQIFVDTLGPIAETALEPGGSGEYEPVIPGTGNYFYFPFSLEDSTNHGASCASGVEPVGAGALLQGGFAWVNGASSEREYGFQWAVTSSTSEPGLADWKPGKTSPNVPGGEEEFPFAQKPETQYLHIRLNDTGYAIWNSKLVFYPKDNAGNQGETEFPLDYIADEVGPSYVSVGYSTDYDAGTGEGSITANIEINDPSKVDPGYIYYQWVQSGQSPDGAGWTRYEGAGDAATSLSLSIPIDDLASGSAHALDLYLNAKDELGHESVSQAFPFQLDLTFPIYKLTDVYDRVSVNPEFRITPPNPHPNPVDPDNPTPSTIIVMIKDPLDMDSDKYFVRTLNSTRGWGMPGEAPLNDDLLAELLWTEANQYYAYEYQDSARTKRLGSWRYVKLIENSSFTLVDDSVVDVVYGFAHTEEGKLGLADDLLALLLYGGGGDTQPNAQIAAAQRLMAIMDGRYYGDIEVTVITGYGATGRGTWQEVEPGSSVYDVNSANSHDGRTNFVNEAAYCYDPGSDDPAEGYYYDQECQHKVVPESLGSLWRLHNRESTGYFVSYIPKNAVVKAQTWTLRAASNNVGLVQQDPTQSGDPLETYQPTGDYSGNELFEYNLAQLSLPHSCHIQPENDGLGGLSSWTSPDDGPRYVSSLDGENIVVSLANSIVPSWGVADVDFTGSYVRLHLLSSPESGAQTGVVYQTPLDPDQGSVQMVKLPAVTTYSGHYRLEVLIRAKASGAVATYTYDNIYVDRMEIGEFGLAKVESEMNSELLNRTDTAWYGYDSVEKPDATYTHVPSIRLGNAVSVPDNEFPASLTHRLFFTAKTEGVPDAGDPNVRYGDLFIKVWNATGGPGKEAAKWVPIAKTCDTGIKAVFVDSVESIDSASYRDTDGATPTVPLALPPDSGEAGFQNVLQYQVVSSNGKASAVRTLLVTVSNETAQFEVELNPDDDPTNPAFLVDHTMARLTRLQSSIPEPLPAYAYLYQDGAYIQKSFEGEAVRISHSGTHWFYAVNAYGNYKFVKKVVDFVDGTPPVVTDVYHAQFSDHFELEYRITDNYMPDGVIPEGLSFYMRFGPSAPEDPGDPPDPDADYMESLGYERYEFVKINLPDYASAGPGDPDPVWVATEPSPIGVYEATAKRDGLALLVHLKGVFKYDDQKAYWQAITRQIQVYAEDAAGNRSSIVSDSATMQNITPHFRYYGMEPPRDSITYERGSAGDTTNVKAEFNIPVILHEPRGRVASPEFSTVKDQLLIYGDEYSHLFLFTDIFGDYHEKFANVLCIGNDSLDVTFSTTEPTSGSVVVDIRVAMPESGLTFSAWKGSVGDDENLIASNTDSVSVEVVENTTIHCMLWPDTASARLVQIPVTNIYKSPPVAGVVWYYSEFASNSLPGGVEETTVEQTTGEVKAYLVSLDERSIYPINGTSDSHTFTYGDTAGSHYRFEFADQARNTGSLDVYLPVDIVLPEPATDATRPKYLLDVWAKEGEIYHHRGAWGTVTEPAPSDPASFDDVLESISWTSGYLLKLREIEDESPTKVVVLSGHHLEDDLNGTLKYNDASDGVPGVSVVGKNVIVDGSQIPSGEVDFTLAIVDQSDNVAALAVSVGEYLDAEEPVIDIDVVKTGFYSTRLYIKLSDAKSGQAQLVSPPGLPVGDPDSGHPGEPYLDFTENRSVELVAEDPARNRATKTVTVSDIDTSPPVCEVLWWSPCYTEVVDGVYVMNRLRAPDGYFNKDIQVAFGFNKIVQSITISIPGVNDSDVGDYVTYELTGDRATLTFIDSIPSPPGDIPEVTLEFTAQNGKSRTLTLTYGEDFTFVIDKTPPSITVTTEGDLPNKASVKVTFTVDNEPVKMDDETEYNPGQQIVKAIAARGTFAYRFADRAGNFTVKEIEVKNIDVEPPVIMVMGEDNGGVYKRGSHTFHATLNEEGTISFQGGPPIDVAAPDPRRNDPDDKLNVDDIDSATPDCDWKALTVTKNGTYQIEATDLAGRKSYWYVTVSCLDNTPPSILFSSPTVFSVVEGTTREALEDMLEDFTGVVATDNVTPGKDIQLALDVSGAVLDRSGYTTVLYTATDQAGNQRVMSRDVRVYPADEIIVSVNGVKTDPQSTTVLRSASEYRLTIENLASDKEPVKIYLRRGRFTAGQMKSDASRIDTTFTVSDKGYYTLYIVSQSRQAYLTYLYIE
jgi:hypothetical protein